MFIFHKYLSTITLTYSVKSLSTLFGLPKYLQSWLVVSGSIGCPMHYSILLMDTHQRMWFFDCPY